MTENSESTRALLRHLVATLAYRGAKVLRDVPPSFAQFSSGRDTRSPVQILEHLGDLMAWGLRMAQGEYLWRAGGSGDWNTEVRRFFEGLRALDQFLASDAPLGHPAAMLIQRPLADALSHVGQLSMFCAVAGIPGPAPRYAPAEIVAG